MIDNETLATREDIIFYDTSDDHSYAETRCPYIVDTEEELFNKCFGPQWYEALLADKIKFVREGSADTTGKTIYKIYVRTDSYTAGDHVFDQSTARIFEVVQDTTGTESLADERFFAKPRKFKTDANEFIWRRYLGRIIATATTNSGLLARLIQDTSGGLVKNYKEGSSRAASLKEAQALKSETGYNIERAKDNMDQYIQRNKGSYSLYKVGIPCNGCSSTAGALPNLGFNVVSAKDRRYGN